MRRRHVGGKRRARTGLLKEGQRGRGRFAATFFFDHCNTCRNAVAAVVETSPLAPCTLRRLLLQQSPTSLCNTLVYFVVIIRSYIYALNRASVLRGQARALCCVEMIFCLLVGICGS